MMFGEDPFGLAPPGFRKSPEQEEFERKVKAFQKASHDHEIAERRTVLEYAWLLCSCRPWYDRAQPGVPAQAGCPVHSGVIVTLDGEVI